MTQDSSYGVPSRSGGGDLFGGGSLMPQQPVAAPDAPYLLPAGVLLGLSDARGGGSGHGGTNGGSASGMGRPFAGWMVAPPPY